MRALLLVCAVFVMGVIPDAQAQAPGSSAEGNIHVAIYVEVMPTSLAAARSALERYRAATLKEDGNLRC